MSSCILEVLAMFLGRSSAITSSRKVLSSGRKSNRKNVLWLQLLRESARDNPKGNMGHDQYTVPDTVAVEPTFVAFL